MKKAIVLTSGGLDSTTVLAIARSEGFELSALSVDYGQRHRHELEAAERVARFFGVAQRLVVRVDLTAIGGSALTDQIAVPKRASEADLPPGVPVTYVPARNLVLLSLALGWAETLGASDLFIGVNAVDYSGYPDCRPEFIRAFETAANLGLKASAELGRPIRIHAPLARLTKAQIILKGVELGVDYSITHSCYDPDDAGRPCGRCDSCLLRRKGFCEAGLDDPLHYPDSAE